MGKDFSGADVNRWFSAAATLFHEIRSDLGEAEARRIFTSICLPRTPKQEAALRNIELLRTYLKIADRARSAINVG
jgi:hypothetical protein